jgi:hypothetical protein
VTDPRVTKIGAVRAKVLLQGFCITGGLVAIAVSLSACGGSGSTTTSASTSGVVHTPPGGVGTYERPAVGKKGTTVLTLDANGHYTQSFTGNPDAIQGTWNFARGTITFTETGGNSAACVGTPGAYAWDYRAGKLTLRPSSDPCRQRSDDFSLGPFTKRT